MSSTCWLPEVRMSSSWARASAYLRQAKPRTASRTAGTPSLTEYCSMPTGSSRSSRSEISAICAAGKESGAGLPPAKLIRPGSPVCFSSSRMMDGFKRAIRFEIAKSISIPPC